MLEYIKNSLPATMIKKVVWIKGDEVSLMKDGTAYAKVFFNGADKPCYVRRHIPNWVK